LITATSLQNGNDFLKAQSAVDFLELAFPGWEWTAMYDQGVLSIRNLTLHGQWGMVLSEKQGKGIDKMQVLKAGGEMLERFGMPYVCTSNALAQAKEDYSGFIKSEKWTPDRRYYNKAEKRWKV